MYLLGVWYCLIGVWNRHHATAETMLKFFKAVSWNENVAKIAENIANLKGFFAKSTLSFLCPGTMFHHIFKGCFVKIQLEHLSSNFKSLNSIVTKCENMT